MEAAKVARVHDIRIYTIAIGDPASLGEEALDEETLRRVADITDGAYYQALDQAQLAAAYAEIASLEPQLFETNSFRPRYSLHHIPLALVMIYYSLYHALASWMSRRRRGTAHVK